MSKVIVIGGGASGIIASLKACEKNEVTIIESNEKIGKKILITGNGKCNFWNDDINIDKYYADNLEKLKNILDSKDLVYDYLTRNLGIYSYNKNGYIYPYSNTAASINETFKKALEQNKIKILYNTKVIDITPHENNIELTFSDNTKMSADKVIIATGSKASPKTGSDGNGYELLNKLGLKTSPISPALVPLISDNKFLSEWANIRANVKLMIYKNGSIVKEEVGEVQLTDYGISGIVTFNISSIVSELLKETKNVDVYIDFIPSENNLLELLNRRNKHIFNQTVETLLETMFNYKLIHIFLKLANIDRNTPWDKIEDKNNLINIIKKFKLNIIGTKNYDQAQVCHGGLSLNEIDNNFKLNKYKNISIIGEILDVDGICGGYNLAFAFISGYLAGEHIND